MRLTHFLANIVDEMEEARNEAVQRLSDKAQKLGATAVVGIKFTTAEIMQGAAEVMAYGTAVTLE